jgi:hypothetical protein
MVWGVLYVTFGHGLLETKVGKVRGAYREGEKERVTGSWSIQMLVFGTMGALWMRPVQSGKCTHKRGCVLLTFTAHMAAIIMEQLDLSFQVGRRNATESRVINRKESSLPVHSFDYRLPVYP